MTVKSINKKAAMIANRSDNKRFDIFESAKNREETIIALGENYILLEYIDFAGEEPCWGWSNCGTIPKGMNHKCFTYIEALIDAVKCFENNK